jgi:hypothetical protein
MSKVFNLAFQTSTNFSDSPGAIVSDSVVYAYATQGSKTFLVFENGTSRLANNTLGSVKVGLGLVSIGVPTRVNGNAWNNGEVVINQKYLNQVYDGTTRRVEMNWPATSPIVFTTSTTLPSIVSAAAAADKGYAEFVCLITQSIGAPTITTIKNEISDNVSATYVSPGVYNLVFGSISTTLAGGGIFPANNGSLNITLQNGNYTNPIGTALWFEAYRSDDARIAIESYDGVDLVDNVLANAMLQVRLYY